MFNEYVWELYLKSNGKEIVNFFENAIKDQDLQNYSDKIRELHGVYCPSKRISDNICNSIDELYKDLIDEDRGFLYGCYSILEMPKRKYDLGEVLNIFYNGLCESGKRSDKDVMSEFIYGMPYYTTILSMLFPDFFIPFYFQYSFNILERIMNEFNIVIPEIPLKRDYKKRVYFYGEICKSFIDFRKAHSMSPYELYAFLYDFAPNYIGGSENFIISELPEAQGVYFIGGDKDDVFLTFDKETIIPWQCNPDVKVQIPANRYADSDISGMAIPI